MVRGSRVVNRSNNNANTNGGVAYVNANNDASNTNSNYGSRLANRKDYMLKRSSQPRRKKCRTTGMDYLPSYRPSSLTTLSEIVKEVKNHGRWVWR